MDRFGEGLAAEEIGNKYGYIDTKGKIVINPQFDSAKRSVTASRSSR